MLWFISLSWFYNIYTGTKSYSPEFKIGRTLCDIKFQKWERPTTNMSHTNGLYFESYTYYDVPTEPYIKFYYCKTNLYFTNAQWAPLPTPPPTPEVHLITRPRKKFNPAWLLAVNYIFE